MPDFDTTHLLKLLRQHTHLPAAPGWTDADCLRLLTSHMYGYLLPMVTTQWQEHLLSSDANTWTVPLVEGQREYVLPPRAVGAGVRKAVLVGPNNARRALRLYEVDKQEEWSTQRQSTPEGYVLRGGRLYLHPQPRDVVGWYLRAQFLIRPAQLCLISACDRIGDVVALTSTTVTYELDSNAVGGASDGPLVVDVVRSTPPFETLALEATGTFSGGDGLTVTFPLASLPPERAAIGDYVCPRGFAPFVQLPGELLEVLATRTAVAQLGATGDTDVAGALAAPLAEERKDAAAVVAPRTGEARLQGNGMRKFRGPGPYGSGPGWW